MATGAAATHTHGKPVTDYAFEMAASTIRFGEGVTSEIGADVRGIGAKRILVVADPNVAALPGGPVHRVLASLAAAGLREGGGSAGSVVVFTGVSIEPTDSSFRSAIDEARRVAPDAFVAVGGGSAMDTAKAANLYYSHPTAQLLDFVNAPVGRGLPVPGPLRPLFAIPTTAGTGSETTGGALKRSGVHVAGRRVCW